jgi:hypothetical protein
MPYCHELCAYVFDSFENDALATISLPSSKAASLGKYSFTFGLKIDEVFIFAFAV